MTVSGRLSIRKPPPPTAAIEIRRNGASGNEAIVWLERARIGNPGSPWPYIWLAAAYALKGETDRAAAELDEARGLLGEGSFPSIA
jgi:hypothetical protein